VRGRFLTRSVGGITMTVLVQERFAQYGAAIKEEIS
jgi:hypothetical protein